MLFYCCANVAKSRHNTGLPCAIRYTIGPYQKPLQILDLSSNQISSMKGLQGHMLLECINLAENDVGICIKCKMVVTCVVRLWT